MRVGDASALVVLCVEQPHSDRARALLASDPAIAAWWASPGRLAAASRAEGFRVGEAALDPPAPPV